MALTHPAPATLDYSERPDEDLVAAAKAGESLAMEFLLNKYKNFVRIKAKSYFLIGADREDIIQEGMIGLYKAVRDFKADKLSSFRAFAELCITRQIITAIKTATRQKHIPLNQYISLNKPIYDEDSERTLLDVMPSNKTSDPEDLVINQEVSEDIKSRIQENLSDLESQVLLSYLEGNLETGQPSACVHLQSDPRDHSFDGQLMVTSRCTTFNDLDSEIRRLQARLDEIRSRAKKMFYKTQEFATSA